MDNNNIDTSKPLLGRIVHIFLFLYLFLLIFPHTTTTKEIAFWIAFLCWVVLRLRKSESFMPLNPVTISLSLFMVIAFISSVIGMGPIENINRFKEELLPIFILFLITATEYRTIQKAKNLLIALVIAFAIYTFLVIWKSFNYGLVYFLDRATRENLWLDGYAHMGIPIFSITLGMLLLMKDNRFKYFLLFFAGLEFFIIAAYSFTPLIGVIAVLLLWAFFAKPKGYRLWMKSFIIGVIILSVFLLNIYGEHSAVKEYKTRLYSIRHPLEEIKSTSGFTDRVLLWHAAVDIIKDRPLLGYGWGMKKYTKLVQQEKFLEEWRVNKPSVYNFYTTFRGVFFPPHNLFLEIVIQSGLLGLSAFIIFIGIYLYYLFKNILRNSSDTDRNFSIILVGGTFLSFMIMNLMNNELGNVGGEIFFVVLGIGAAWINNKSKSILEKSNHR